MKRQAPCASTLISTITSIFLLLQQISLTNAKHHKPCQPTSCGKIHNITYPFRLKTDPSHCGNTRYELDCNKNGASLTLFTGKYYVQNIDYKTHKILLTDAGVVEDTNCSFIPRYFLYEQSFKNVMFGSDDFGSEPFILDPIGPPRVAYFNCVNSINDTRYVKVEGNNRSECGVKGNVYAVLEPSLYEYRDEDIKVGCDFLVATLGSSGKVSEILRKRRISYDDIRGMIIGGVEVSWLPAICEERCGKGVNCKVVDEEGGEVQCDQHLCHYAYQTTDKCSLPDQVFGYTRAYLRGVFIGLGSRITFSTRQLDNPVGLEYFDGGIFIGRNVLPIFILARYLLGVTLVLVLFIYKWRRRHLSVYDNIENFLLDSNLNPIRYEYKEIKKMTGNFRVKLGQGGFGAVYKGKLRSGPDVAIKMLTKSNANHGQDFINEVATIGRIHHVNVVRLVGYCVEGKKSALVYEFMPNGSLDKHIFPKELGSVALSYEKVYEISLGIAHGIAYLHQGCDMQILHFDIKPHNILLDDNFIPKVSDFGLAKLYPVNDSIVPLTAARGTLGYMAPELFYKNIGGVSYKADVYSFGMLLMEMAGKRKNTNPQAEHSSQYYFPFWIYDKFKEEKEFEMEDMSDEGMTLLKKMFLVAFWCIQLKPSDRPSMNKVVEMLEGDGEGLELPPRPSFYPNETYKRHDDISSGQISLSDSTSLEESFNDYSMENNTLD